MEKTSKIKQVINCKEFTSRHGDIFYHNLVMENGDKINIGKKKRMQEGFELTYEVIGDKNPDGTYQQEYPKAKSVQSQQNNFKPQTGGFKADPKKQTIIVAQSSMTKAIDILLSGVVPMQFESVNDFVNKAEALTDLLIQKQIELTNKHYQNF